MSDTKFCKYCRATIPADSLFCTACGKPLTAARQAPPAIQEALTKPKAGTQTTAAADSITRAWAAGGQYTATTPFTQSVNDHGDTVFYAEMEPTEEAARQQGLIKPDGDRLTQYTRVTHVVPRNRTDVPQRFEEMKSLYLANGFIVDNTLSEDKSWAGWDDTKQIVVTIRRESVAAGILAGQSCVRIEEVVMF